MAAHIEWGHTDHARLHVLEPRQALEDLAPADGRINGNAVLVLDGGNGDGAAIEGDIDAIRTLLLRALDEVTSVEERVRGH